MMRLRSRIHLLQLFSAAVVDQLLLSGANFVIGILLIRNISDADYALFVLVQATVLLLITAQSAWLTGPIAILAPKRAPEFKDSMIGALEAALHRFLWRLALIAICIPALGYLARFWDGFSALILAVGVLASWAALRREYVRRMLMVYSRTNALLAADAVYVAVVVGGTAVGALALRHGLFWAVAAMAAAGWIGERAGHRALAPAPAWAPGSATPYMRDIRRLGLWAAVGALSYWLFGQGYNYILATRLDLRAVMEVNASRLLIMPAMVFTIGMEGLLVPKAAGWFASDGVRVLLKRLAAIFLAVAVIEVGYFVLVWILREWLTHDFLHKVIGDRDRLLLLWGCIALIGLLRTVVQSALFALEPLKRMAGITGAGAIVSLGFMWFAVKWWGPAGALMGQIAGDTVVIVGFWLLLRQESRGAQGR